MTQQRIALFAGSFDPFTIGHKSIVDRGLQLFDGIVIAIGINPAKKPWQPLEQRIALLEKIYADDSRIKIATFSGLSMPPAGSEHHSFCGGCAPWPILNMSGNWPISTATFPASNLF